MTIQETRCDSYYIPPDPPISRCICDHILEDRTDDGAGEPLPCEVCDCVSFDEYSYEDYLADEADKAYSLRKEGL